MEGDPLARCLVNIGGLHLCLKDTKIVVGQVAAKEKPFTAELVDQLRQVPIGFGASGSLHDLKPDVVQLLAGRKFLLYPGMDDEDKVGKSPCIGRGPLRALMQKAEPAPE